MTPEQISELVVAMVAATAAGAVLGGMLWGMLRDVARSFARWLEKRANPPTPAQLLSVAAAMRKRAGVLAIEAEKLRLATLPK